MKNYVYLAGSITKYWNDGKLDQALMWRKIAVESFKNSNIECYNPCKNFEHNKDYNRKMFLQQNNLFLNKSNIMLVDLKHICQSGGTLFELAVAYNKDMQIISFGDIKNNFTEEIFGHYKQIIKSGINFQTYDEAINYISTMFDQ